MGKDFEVGNEIKIYTKDGKSYRGILMDYHKGYLSTIISLGIILTIPINAIINIVKI